MIKKEHIEAIEGWLDEGYKRACKEGLCGTMLDILEQKDRVKKLKQVDEPIVVKHIIEEKKVVKPLKTRLKEYIVGIK